MESAEHMNETPHPRGAGTSRLKTQLSELLQTDPGLESPREGGDSTGPWAAQDLPCPLPLVPFLFASPWHAQPSGWNPAGFVYGEFSRRRE